MKTYLKVKRVTDEKYLTFVRSLPCVVTGRPAQAHHLIGHGQGGMGTKSGDDLAFPLSFEVHRELHDIGYKSWEDKYGSQWLYVEKTQQAYKEAA